MGTNEDSTSQTPARQPVLLQTPREGVPDVLTTPEQLNDAAARLAAGTGPVAVDAERASGYRYGSAAYLIQLRRENSGTFLIDPVPLPDLSVITEALGTAEWVLHAASQDLACLREVNLTPGGRLFDTELGARLAGFPRVGLAAITEEMLGLTLAKEHSAVDWSIRPLKQSWLTYAALDVEVLVELRDALLEELQRQGKLEWAWQEFHAVRDAPPAPPRQDPWRRTSGSHTLRNRHQLAVLRALWESRDELARRRNIAPGRILPDRALIAAATAMPRTQDQLLQIQPFDGPNQRRQAARWMGVITGALDLGEDQLPIQQRVAAGPPPPRVWKQKAPEAAARLNLAREHMAQLSEHHNIPVENLLTPDLLRRLCWEPPEDAEQESLAQALTTMGARPWQAGLCSPGLAQAFAAAQRGEGADVPDPQAVTTE